MPRTARIDAPESLHHIIRKGIERRSIFRDEADRDSFVECFGRELRIKPQLFTNPFKMAQGL